MPKNIDPFATDRMVLEGEKCYREGTSTWCERHEATIRPGKTECPRYPIMANVVADLLATLERVSALAEELTEQGDHHVPGCEGQADCARCVQLDIRKILKGHGHA